MATPQYGGAPPAARPNHRQDNHWLDMRQEPEKARVVVRGKEKDRKPVDPPPIVQLKVQDPYNDTCSFLHNPYYFCTCTLWEPETDAPKKQDTTPGATPPELLQGQLVSSLHRLKDFDNTEQGFFVFSDISVGIMGKFRLRFSLYEYRPATNDTVFLKEILSKVFEVVAPKDWDGVRESTALSRSFADQGVRIRLRKESRHSSKRPFQNQQGQSLAPQTPLRPHPAQQGSYSAGGEEAAGMDSGEPPYKRQRSFPGQAQGYNMAPAQQQQNWQQQQQSGYPAIPQQQGMYRDQNTGQMYGQGPYYNAPAPYGQYPAQQANQAAFMPQAGYGSNGSTPQGQQQQYANAQQRGQYVQNTAQNYNANTYNNQAYANLAQRYPSQPNQYGSPQAGQATVPSNYQQSPYGTGSPYAANQQTPGQPGQQGQQGRAPYFNQGQQGGQYTASGQPSPAQPMGQMANASNTPRLKQLNTAVAQHNDVVDPAMHQHHLQQRAAQGMYEAARYERLVGKRKRRATKAEMEERRAAQALLAAEALLNAGEAAKHAAEVAAERKVRDLAIATMREQLRGSLGHATENDIDAEDDEQHIDNEPRGDGGEDLASPEDEPQSPTGPRTALAEYDVRDSSLPHTTA